MDFLKINQRITKKTTQKSSKRRKGNKNDKHGAQVRSRTTIDCLPTEMVAKVLARVAASSPVDLFHCKLSCKGLHEISDEKHVLQCVSFESLYERVYLRDEARSFFKRCLESNNPDALLRFGMGQYFNHKMLEEGLRNMEKAVEQGNKVAAYVLALIHLCYGDEVYAKRGTELMMNTIRGMGGKGIVECRKKLHDMLRWLWSSNKPDAGSKPKILCAKQEQHSIKNGWDRLDYYGEGGEDSVACEACKCAREVDFFYHIMHAV